MVVPHQLDLPLLLCAFGFHDCIWVSEHGVLGPARYRRCTRCTRRCRRQKCLGREATA